MIFFAICVSYSGFNYQDITYVTNQTEVYTILASTLFLHHLPSFAQSVKSGPHGRFPKPKTLHASSAQAARRFTIAGCRARKNGRFFLFDFARQALIPLPEHIRQFPRRDDSPGAPAHSRWKGLWRYIRFGR